MTLTYNLHELIEKYINRREKTYEIVFSIAKVLIFGIVLAFVTLYINSLNDLSAIQIRLIPFLIIVGLLCSYYIVWYTKKKKIFSAVSDLVSFLITDKILDVYETYTKLVDLLLERNVGFKVLCDRIVLGIQLFAHYLYQDKDFIKKFVASAEDLKNSSTLNGHNSDVEELIASFFAKLEASRKAMPVKPKQSLSFIEILFILSSLFATLSLGLQTTVPISWNITSASEAIIAFSIVSPFLFLLINFLLFFVTFRKRYSPSSEEQIEFLPKIRSALNDYCFYFQGNFKKRLQIDEKRKLLNLLVSILIEICCKENPTAFISKEDLKKLMQSFCTGQN